MMENVIERVLVAARWILAPFYLGLVLALLVLLFKFGQELIHFVLSAPHLSEEDTILGALSVIDLTLMGSLVLIVMFSGYENFVSRIDATGHSDWPEWMTKVDFAGLKLKLLASIVLISAMQVLKGFMSLEKLTDRDLIWLVGIHLVFVFSSVFLALSDWLQSRAGKAEH
jgi:uncharacterized protein (TIGR00645 family)